MGNYKLSGPRFDRLRLRTGIFALSTALLAACASTPPPMPEPEAGMTTQGVGDSAAGTPTDLAPVTLRPNAPLIYVVKKGDTLWDIANHFLLDPWQWPEIWYVNDQVRNPHLIYPGDVLKLVYGSNGQPQLGVERVSPQIRESALEGAIPTIPIDAIRDFLRGPRFVTADELAKAPYLLAFADHHIIGGQGNLIFVKKLPKDPESDWAMVRQGRAYRDPDDNKLLGYEGVPVGQAEIRELGDPATAVIAESAREALVGDFLLPVEPELFDANFYPHAPAGPVGGRIISVFDGVSQIGQYQIVAINRGASHGLEPGHVLHILQIGDKVSDPYGSRRVQLPDQYAGQLLVFKTTPRVSYALVMSVIRPVHELDKVEKPQPSRR